MKLRKLLSVFLSHFIKKLFCKICIWFIDQVKEPITCFIEVIRIPICLTWLWHDKEGIEYFKKSILSAGTKRLICVFILMVQQKQLQRTVTTATEEVIDLVLLLQPPLMKCWLFIVASIFDCNDCGWRKNCTIYLLVRNDFWIDLKFSFKRIYRTGHPNNTKRILELQFGESFW
jgi:hypothetical protein